MRWNNTEPLSKKHIELVLYWLDTRHIKIESVEELFTNSNCIRSVLETLDIWTKNRAKQSLRELVKKLIVSMDNGNISKDQLVILYRTFANIYGLRLGYGMES